MVEYDMNSDGENDMKQCSCGDVSKRKSSVNLHTFLSQEILRS